MDKMKIYSLVTRLLERSKTNNVEWEKTNKESVYQVSLPNYSLRISELIIVKKSPLDSRQVEYELSIFNEAGEMIDKFTDEDLSEIDYNSHAVFKDLFSLARRSSFGVEGAIDEIMGYL